MIKLKDLLFEQEEKKIHPKVSHWKNKKAQEYASLLLNKYGDYIKGISHITGGGLIDNVPRILDEDCNIEINCKWDVPNIFKWIHEKSPSP